MSTHKKTHKMNFWLVVLGLFLVIGLVAGGTYLLDKQGVISMGTDGPGELPEGMSADAVDFEAGADRPARPDFEEGGDSFNSESLLGVLRAALQMAVVVVVVAGGQTSFSKYCRQRIVAPA